MEMTGLPKGIIVLDCETTQKNVKTVGWGDFSASPFYPDNTIRMGGFKVLAFSVNVSNREMFVDNIRIWVDKFIKDGITPILVGHNIKFDALYLMKECEYLRDRILLGEVILYDTALHDLHFYGTQWASLESVAKRWGIEFEKDEEVVKVFERNAEHEIDDATLKSYLKEDVWATYKVFMNQWEDIKNRSEEQRQHLWLDMRMTGLLVCMEWRGMVVDHKEVRRVINEHAHAMSAMEANVDNEIKEAVANDFLCDPIDAYFNINIASPKQLKAFIFGGDMGKHKTYEPTGEVYKTGVRKGEPKAKVVYKKIMVDGYASLSSNVAALPHDTSSETLQSLKSICAATPRLWRLEYVVDSVLEYRSLQKESGILQSWIDCMDEHNRVHPTYHQVATPTGRLSCSKPNLQQVPPKLRDFFVSDLARTKFAMADLEQIEIVVQAFLSGDESFKQDVRDRVDFHSKRAAAVEGVPYAKFKELVDRGDPKAVKARRVAKTFSFQRAYGASPAAIAKSTGMALTTVQKFIDAENALYPAVEGWASRIHSIIERNRLMCINYKDDSAGPMSSISVCGKRYFFQGNEPDPAKPWMKGWFKPTQTRNYPVQGLAAEIWKLWFSSICRSAPWAVPVHGTHDDGVWQIPSDRREEFKLVVDAVCDSLPDTLKEKFGVDFDLPIRYTIKYDDVWQ
jgi:DNA polymerase I-like protein with 3'-5' exonuclease and polymerase domains